MANAQIDLNNERQYLSNLVNTGDEGQRLWAQNKAKEYGISLSSTPTQTPPVNHSVPSTATPYVVQPQLPQMPSRVDQEAEMARMFQMNQQMGNANFEQQKAQLDMMLESQLAQLKMAYDQAITDGKISVREAESQFEEQSKAIEQQAYQDAERMGLYTQEMGIQNSQQAIGLMQGDNARTASLINQNITTRDKRVNDIRDRLNSIRKQKSLDLARAQAEHGYGVLGARAEANQQIAQNAFGLMQDNYIANRDQQFTQENMYLNDYFQRGQNEQLQTFNRENIETQFRNSLEAMSIQHGFDMEKIDVTFNNQLIAMAKEHGYSKELEAMRQSGRLNEIRAQQNFQLEMLNREVQEQQAALARQLDPNSNEFKLAELQLKRERNSVASKIMSEQSATVWTELVFNNPDLPEYGSTTPEIPRNYYIDWDKENPNIPGVVKAPINAFSGLLNWATGYDDKMSQLNRSGKAVRNVYDYFDQSGIDVNPWTVPPDKSALKRRLEKEKEKKK